MVPVSRFPAKYLSMIFAILLTVVVSFVVVLLIFKNNKIRKLKADYESALKGNDKDQALKAGRKYYAALRGYKDLTALDELDLTKDISTMK